MNQTSPKPKTVNTLSVRLPPELYNQIAEMALTTGDTLNGVFIKVVRLGLSREVDRDQAVRDFVFSVVTKERMRELLDGKSEPVTT